MYKVVIIASLMVVMGCSSDGTHSNLTSSGLDISSYSSTVYYSLYDVPLNNTEVMLELSDDSYVFDDDSTTKTLTFTPSNYHAFQSVVIKRNTESVDSYQDNFSKLCVQPTVIATSDFDSISITIENPNSPIIRNMGAISTLANLDLSAEINHNMHIPVKVSYEIMNKDNPNLVDIRKHFRTLGLSASHTIPIMGLYEDNNNIIKVYSIDENNSQCYIDIYTVQTEELALDTKMVMTVENADYSKIQNSWVLSSGSEGSAIRGAPQMFDLSGNIRFRYDYEKARNFRGFTFRDDKMYAEVSRGAANHSILELNFAGVDNDSNKIKVDGYNYHHDFVMLDNGSFVILIDNNTEAEVEDRMILVDPSISRTEARAEWDMKKVLDMERLDFFNWKDGGSFERSIDWLHQNAVTFDEYDKTVIASGRHQGVTKTTIPDNNGDFELKWIISPHRGFNTTDINAPFYMADKLLQPLDKDGNPITDIDVIDGSKNHPDFEWSWVHHSVNIVKRDGDLLNITLFDNGLGRNFGASDNYSRVVEYQIDEANMTIKQIFAYGKDRGTELFSNVMSAAAYFADVQNYYMSSTITGNAAKRSIAVEVTKDMQEIFHAHFGMLYAYRTYRIKPFDYMRMPNKNIN